MHLFHFMNWWETRTENLQSRFLHLTMAFGLLHLLCTLYSALHCTMHFFCIRHFANFFFFPTFYSNACCFKNVWIYPWDVQMTNHFHWYVKMVWTKWKSKSNHTSEKKKRKNQDRISRMNRLEKKWRNFSISWKNQTAEKCAWSLNRYAEQLVFSHTGHIKFNAYEKAVRLYYSMQSYMNLCSRGCWSFALVPVNRMFSKQMHSLAYTHTTRNLFCCAVCIVDLIRKFRLIWK